MPFLHFSTTKALTPPQKAALSAGIADCVRLLPGKPADRAMIRIDAGCEIYRGGEIAECAFLETVFQKPTHRSAEGVHRGALRPDEGAARLGNPTGLLRDGRSRHLGLAGHPPLNGREKAARLRRAAFFLRRNRGFRQFDTRQIPRRVL